MPTFFQYARNITYYLLFSALLGMTAPNDKYKKYIALVSGFVLICLILQPLRPILNGGIPVTELFAQIVPSPQTETVPDGGDTFEATYTQWRYDALKAAFEAQLNDQLYELLDRNGYELKEATYDCAEDFSRIYQISVAVTPRREADAKPFIRIEPVQIGVNGEDEHAAQTGEVKKMISDFYGLPEEHIYVSIRA